MSDEDVLFDPRDELPVQRELTSVGMLRWHLERFLHWSAVLDMTSRQIVLAVKAEIAEEPRRMRPKTVRPAINQRTRAEILVRDGLRCRNCGSTRNLEIDHVHPVSKGGRTHPDNLQVLCKHCNRAKRDRVASTENGARSGAQALPGA